MGEGLLRFGSRIVELLAGDDREEDTELELQQG